mmetsp:Transcript_31399/g.73283  ORF Transcript_31399/g.73283 Transcript_31399/m.73283 type:complete len:447 (-) Transcript_31399:144-1484(-)|eukprot:CAMPEP_0178436560 /NCGR_PEP_ID=MMETSP0689_2-20121128/34503_1 /TAXON_ID=160604 /ORGANISM="Amphidinium massartii, Strain CS-259" /LENGTH=446 /DNA_ID=CAMNT_0020058661 /DNA_START=14 /DNA_END=1354 /DNA_ORIENTATION=+
MTVYYDPQQSVVRSLLSWHGTVFSLVLRKPEFWLYILLHFGAVTVCIFFLEEGNLDNFPWAVATVMQHFMTFFITFYNDMCYERYMLIMYPACTEMMDSVALFIQEMNISLHHQQLYRHRIAATKYLTAAVHEFYMIVTGGKMSRESWQELVNRGLLTTTEAEMLMLYPDSRTTLVLTSWVLFIIRDALFQDCCWQPRSQQTVHIFNRHIVQVKKFIRAANRVGNYMAMPILFGYYHLMNVILLTNILLLAIVPAFMRTYLTVFPFSVALLIYFGLREVSMSLADPFGKDVLDFPVPSFVNHIFDRCICLLEAFALPETRSLVIDQVHKCRNFTDEQLKRIASDKVIYQREEGKPVRSEAFGWGVPPALHDIPPEVDIRQYLLTALSSGDQPLSRPTDDLQFEEKDPPEVAQLAEERQKGEDLRLDIADLKMELERMRTKILEMEM